MHNFQDLRAWEVLSSFAVLWMVTSANKYYFTANSGKASFFVLSFFIEFAILSIKAHINPKILIFINVHYICKSLKLASNFLDVQ